MGFVLTVIALTAWELDYRPREIADQNDREIVVWFSPGYNSMDVAYKSLTPFFVLSRDGSLFLWAEDGYVSGQIADRNHQAFIDRVQETGLFELDPDTVRNVSRGVSDGNDLTLRYHVKGTSGVLRFGEPSRPEYPSQYQERDDPLQWYEKIERTLLRAMEEIWALTPRKAKPHKGPVALIFYACDPGGLNCTGRYMSTGEKNLRFRVRDRRR